MLLRQPITRCSLSQRRHVALAARSHVVVKAASATERQDCSADTDSPTVSPVDPVDRHRGFLLASERLEQLLDEAYLR